MHKSGFVTILGKPNAGKSSLMNAILGEKLSIISPKAQTTRHRIKGILSDDDFQIVFSDTPGFIEKSAYKLHDNMIHFIESSLEDADLFLWVIDSAVDFSTDIYTEKIKESKLPVIVVLNKSDLIKVEDLSKLSEKIQMESGFLEIIAVSVKNKTNIHELLDMIKKYIPEGEPWYNKDQLTDKSERFVASEIVREKILLNYREEIPYSVEISIRSFKDEPHILRIESDIYVSRDSQRIIMIGRGGLKLKKTGTEARIDMEKFWNKKVFLKLHVKVKKDWRDDPLALKFFGYNT